MIAVRQRKAAAAFSARVWPPSPTIRPRSFLELKAHRFVGSAVGSTPKAPGKRPPLAQAYTGLSESSP
jgi:hypothetical protein